MSKLVILIAIGCFALGALSTEIFYKTKLDLNKALTVRILANAIGSMEASQNLAESCSEAYNAATTCVSNLSTCNIQKEAKKLDEFNYKRGQAEEVIDWIGEDMEKIIVEVKTSR